MDKQRIYTVAGHSFGLIMEESRTVWQNIQSVYGAFEDRENEQLLFTLTVKAQISCVSITPILIDPNPKPEDPKLDVYLTPSGYMFEILFPFTENRIGCLYLDKNFSIGEMVLSGSDYEQFSGVNMALMLCYLLATANLQTVLIHASAVINGGKAYLFLGRRGIGKSTHSCLWQQVIPGTVLLNDSHSVLRINNQGDIIAFGSPWGGKKTCYRNDSAPVGGIVQIKRALVNEIRRLLPVEAYASLLTSCFGVTWEKELADRKDRSLKQIIARVACWNLECLPDEAAARLCAQVVKREEWRCNG